MTAFLIIAAIITIGFWIVNALEQIDKDIRSLKDDQ